MTDETTKIPSKYGSRKFIISCVIWVGSYIALLLGELGGGEYVAISSIVLGLFATANVAAKGINLKNENN